MAFNNGLTLRFRFDNLLRKTKLVSNIYKKKGSNALKFMKMTTTLQLSIVIKFSISRLR